MFNYALEDEEVLCVVAKAADIVLVQIYQFVVVQHGYRRFLHNQVVHLPV